MNQSKNKTIVKYFQKKEVEFIDKDGQLWLTAEQLGDILGYKEPRKSINNIFNRHKGLLHPFSGVIKLMTPGGKQDILIFNELGCNIIAMKSTTRYAQEFIIWAANIIREYRHGNLVRNDQKKLPSASFLKEITKTSGVEVSAAIFLRDSIGLPLPPDTIVRNRIRTLGMSDSYLAKMYKYDKPVRMYLEINTGKFENKDALAAMLGLTITQIWGEK